VSFEDKSASSESVQSYYVSYEDCRREVYRLGILNSRQYDLRRDENPKLPPNPDVIYKEFHGWKNFCEQKEVYSTIEECKLAARALGIAGQREYVRRRREDPKLPQNPEQIFFSEFKGWEEFLGFGGAPYESYIEASNAAVRLGCTTRVIYGQLRKQDSRLIVSPMTYYAKDWKGWDHFLQRLNEKVVYEGALDSVHVFKEVRPSTGRRTRTPKARIRPGMVSVEFMSYEDAKRLVVESKIKLQRDYKLLIKKFPRLPPDPAAFYGDGFDGWNEFLDVPALYDSFIDCRNAAQRLGIKGNRDYTLRRREDPRLPADPRMFSEFLGWEHFLGVGDIPYQTYLEASDAVQRLKITSRDLYMRRRKEDLKLVPSPARQYPADWKGWPEFVNSPVRRKPKNIDQLKKYYPTYEEFQTAVGKFGFKTQSDYRSRYIEDPRLPKYPENVYADNWLGWGQAMLGRLAVVPLTWQDTKKILLQYRIYSATDYLARYKLDSRLPSDPAGKYRDFPGWKLFLLPEEYSCLDDVKVAAKILRLKSQKDYESACEIYAVLPKQPETIFAVEWRGWFDLLGQITPYTYEEVQQIFQARGCKTMEDVSRVSKELKDPRIPNNLENVYGEWSNAYDFLSTELPYRLEYVTRAGAGWVDDVQLFLEKNRVKGQYEQAICKFIRHFVEPNGYGNSVFDFLLLGKVNISTYEEFLKSQASPHVGRQIWSSVHQYLEDALKRHFTEEDEDGKIYRVPGASNPLAAVEFAGYKNKLSESNKPVLAYQYVESVKKWIAPVEAKTFSDLQALHGFDADYYPVDESKIDFNDPNCVYRYVGGQYYLWYPGHWMALYALVSVPARGRQIMYNDSGEADEFIVELVDGSVTWVSNTSPLATRNKQEGFVTHSFDGNWGMHFTSNKTSFEGAGYDVAWIPQDLIYWLTVFRDWQRKYNPIFKLTPWVDCARRCNLAKESLKKKGANCFLFRGFEEDQPPSFSGPMTIRLAAAIYHIQPTDYTLATFRGDPSDTQSRARLSRYKSEFTSHSMRVSLITAYIINFGMDPAVIMKIVGHASIVMTIYYVKIGSANMRQVMAEGEKRAQLNQAKDVQLMIEQKRLDELKPMLVSNNREALDALLSGRTGTQLIRDYGICPYAGSRCEDGGEHHTKSWLPVPAGHLGMQNCPRCRHFVTGPVFLGGLTALWNEISLNVKLQWEHYADMDRKLTGYRESLQELENEEFDTVSSGNVFDSKERIHIEVAKRKLQSEMEGVAKKMDMHLCDMQALTKLINESRVVINKQALLDTSPGRDEGLKLIVSDKSELQVGFEDTSLFQQLNEVCVNATIYESASAVMATPRRSQMIDRMTMLNGIRPVMFNLNEKEQLVLGNQVTDFFFRRLKNWERVDQLINGNVMLEDLRGTERISHEEYSELLSSGALGGLGKTSIAALAATI